MCQMQEIVKIQELGRYIYIYVHICERNEGNGSHYERINERSRSTIRILTSLLSIKCKKLDF